MTRPGDWCDTPDEARAWDRQTVDDRPTIFDLDDLPDPPPLSADDRAELVREVAFWQAGGA